MTAAERAERVRAADALCQSAYAGVGFPDSGVALVAVGGYGRRELAPYSDLDLVLVHDSAVQLGDWAGALWYPLWDGGAVIDHSVRSVEQVLDQGKADLRVALGMLDVRHVAGDPNLTLRLRSSVLAQWRREARGRLGELHELVAARGRLLGELAHASVPDLKESAGGLRDATVLGALVATWLVDVPHSDLERWRRGLLDLRDALHEVAGRRGDRVAPEYWADIADRLGLADADADAAQRHARVLGRRITHVSRVVWRRADAVAARPVRPRSRGPRLSRVAPGVAVLEEEVVLDRDARPENDPQLVLRAAAIAAERGAVLSPVSAARLAAQCPPLPQPWPASARDWWVRLLAAGPGLLGVWETLEETGCLDLLLPEWDRVRLLPHASAVHRFTVDRHLIETCIESAALMRRVSRPDVLVVAALLHDIGKGQLTEHCVAGEPIARELAQRWGFEPDAVALIASLVRWHLLLAETATTRDPDDPATVATVTDVVHTTEALGLLAALTEADAKATSAKAWTTWRRRLVETLVRRCAAALSQALSQAPSPAPADAPVDLPPALTEGRESFHVEVSETGDGSQVRVIAADRTGLLADVAAMLSLQRASVRAARAWTQADFGVSVWQVAEEGLDPAVLRLRWEAIAEGRIVPARQLTRPGSDGPAATVAVRSDASRRATVLEVRAANRPGVAFHVAAALADLGITVISAHLSTLGPQAVDVFYVQESAAGALSDQRAADAAHAVRAALNA